VWVRMCIYSPCSAIVIRRNQNHRMQLLGGLSDIHGACAHRSTAAAVCSAMPHMLRVAEVSLHISIVKDVLGCRVKLHV